MTKTQELILSILDKTQFLTPRQVSERAGLNNWGGSARSLRVLMTKGLVEQDCLFKHRRWNLYGYRLATRAEATP